MYEYARAWVEVGVKSREIEIYNIEILNICNQSNSIKIKVDFSKGTYIGSLARYWAKTYVQCTFNRSRTHSD